MEIKVYQEVLKANQRLAEQNRAKLAAAGAYALNFIGSPGSGKTMLLEATIPLLKKRGLSVAVIEGDIATTRDAERIGRLDVPVAQINTRGACHLDAGIVSGPLEELLRKQPDILLIENVGNLVCPTEYDLGEHGKVVVLSLPEGPDKPVKYPAIFRIACATVLSKLDLLDKSGSTLEGLRSELSQIRSDQPVFPLCARTGEGVEAWVGWVVASARRCMPG